MEILGLSHPAVSTAASTMQKLADQARPTPVNEVAETKAGQFATPREQVTLGLAVTDTVKPIDASRESILEARTPVEMTGQDAEERSGGEVSPDSETYEFPEKLPMNFLEMIDMLRVDEPAQPIGGSGGDAMSVSDPAQASEAQRLNLTA